MAKDSFLKIQTTLPKDKKNNFASTFSFSFSPRLVIHCGSLLSSSSSIQDKPWNLINVGRSDISCGS